MNSGSLWRLLSVCIALSLTGCMVQNAEQARDGREAMVGLTRMQVRMCAGLPTKTVEVEGSELWSYERSITGGSSVTLPTLPTIVDIPGPQLSQSSNSYCHTQVRFVEGKAVEVAFAGATDMFGAKDAACGQIVQGCIDYEPPKVSK